MQLRRMGVVITFAAVTAGLSATSFAQMAGPIRIRRPFPVQPGGAGTVNLPYQAPDGAGNMWMVYDGGWMRQNGQSPVFSQGAMLTINNTGLSSGNAATIDPKTNELVLQNMQTGTLNITRRILIDKDTGTIRYIDIFTNSTAQEQIANVMYTTNLNYGVNGAVNVSDPKHKENQIGWVAMTQANRAAVDIFAGKNAKVVPTINYQQGNNMCQTSMQLTVPANKAVAVMHLHLTTQTLDQGTQFISTMKESKLMTGIPADVKKLIVNFPHGDDFISNLDILRGDAFDVVELKSGDSIKGTIKETTFKLTTPYGPIELPTDQVISMANVGQYRPRQLLITADGQIFGGKLDKDTLSLELSSGQVTQVPLSQINRVGYRKRAGEKDDQSFDKPFVVLRSGDRIAVELPSAPIDVATRYGPLKLDPKTIASIDFQNEDSAVHSVTLTDGSKFAGIANDGTFEVKLLTGASAAAVKFPTSSIIRLQLNTKIDEADDSTSTLSLAQGDSLIGTLVGQMKLDTSFDTINVNTPEIRKIIHPTPGSPDVQITLWDNSTVSGQPEDASVQCKLNSGLTMDIPLSLVESYDQPSPQPSAPIIEKIKAIVVTLADDDWKKRDQAQSDLIKMGPSVVSVLKQLRPDAAPEAQNRIDAITKQLGKAGSSTPAPVNGGPIAIPMDQMEK